jgi:glycerol-3-phosphate O-acyltransferase
MRCLKCWLEFGPRGETALLSGTVTLPLWLVVLISVLSILAAIDRFLLPSARWLLRRRFDRAIEDLNTRLKLRIQPF